MGYGGLINKVADPFGLGGSAPTPDVPTPAGMAKIYPRLLAAYQQGAGPTFNAQAEFLPKYTDLGLSNLASIVGNGSGDNSITADVGGVASRLRGLNPGNGLQDTLRGNAATGLAEGSQWNPEDLSRTTNAVRSSWANRGLGTSMPAQLDETLRVLTGGEGLRSQRQQFASGVAGQDTAVTQGLIGDASNLLGAGSAISQGAGPTLFPNAANYDIFNTAYNAQAGANIAGANNQAAAQNSY